MNMKHVYKLIVEYPGSPKMPFETETIENGLVVANNLAFNPEEYPFNWELINKHLFVTEDGEEIYVGDKVYIFENDHIWETIVNEPKEGYYDIFDVLKKCKAFSKKEFAEKYIEENKLIFSKKQIRDAIDKLNVLLGADDKIYINRRELIITLKL